MAAPVQQSKASASEKARANDRGWLSTKELAAAIGWRTHTLRDAIRGRRIPGITRTGYGYYIEASAVASIAELLGPAPAKIRKKTA
jgi:hypothetical protein